MAKNERNYIPKEGRPIIKKYNGTQTSPAAPGLICKAGAEGAKLYNLKYTDDGNSNNTDTIYYSDDNGATFTSIFADSVATGVPETKKLWTDFWTDLYVTDADGNKYINLPANAGFYIDVNSNTNTCTCEAYIEDY